MPNLSAFPLQGKAEEQSENILGWEEKSKQAITAFFDFANLPCPEGETSKGSVNTIVDTILLNSSIFGLITVMMTLNSADINWIATSPQSSGSTFTHCPL